MIRTVAPSPGSREPTDLRTFPPAHLRTFRPSHLHTFTPPYRVKPKIGAKERERCPLSVSFFDWAKNETQKTHPSTALRRATALSCGTTWNLRSKIAQTTRRSDRALAPSPFTPNRARPGETHGRWRRAHAWRQMWRLDKTEIRPRRRYGQCYVQTFIHSHVRTAFVPRKAGGANGRWWTGCHLQAVQARSCLTRTQMSKCTYVTREPSPQTSHPFPLSPFPRFVFFFTLRRRERLIGLGNPLI
jgi:hypothetical protein